jgi:hypothetical protein
MILNIPENLNIKVTWMIGIRILDYNKNKSYE